MRRLFLDKITTEGMIMKKYLPVLARRGIRKERVVTVVSGKTTSDKIIEDDDSMVLRANTIDQELYVIPKKTFEKTYCLPGAELGGMLEGDLVLQEGEAVEK